MKCPECDQYVYIYCPNCKSENIRGSDGRNEYYCKDCSNTFWHHPSDGLI